MKKAEIIKNGNVNLKPIKTKIDWDKIESEFHSFKWRSKARSLFFPKPTVCFNWLKKRIEKELNQ